MAVKAQDIIYAAAQAKLQSLQLAKCFDPATPDSKPNGAQLEFFQDASKIKFRYLVAGNGAGKSQTGARDLTWMIQDQHPYWKMPEEWKSRPLQCLVIGKSRSILENELWAKKIKPFFFKDEWKEVRQGNALQYVEHRQHGHRIIFLSHSDGSQKSIDNLQAFDADIVWLDEMPRKQAVLEETQRRARRPHTVWFATFTPKSVNVQIRKLVEAAKEPVAKRYKMSRLDVPGVDKEKELLALEGLSQSQKNTILYGDFAVADELVYELNMEEALADLPETYSHTWRHVECVDPGSNKGGLTVWAEDPVSKVWYCVLAEYIVGLRDPVAFYDKCQKLTEKYNIVRRICDPAATPHIGHAAARKCSPPYMTPYAKNQGRKEELIKNFQSKLNGGIIKLVTAVCGELIDELSSAERRPNGGIINSHAYHLADCCNYFADLIPKPEHSTGGLTRDAIILKQDDEIRAKEAKRHGPKPPKKLTKDQTMSRLVRLQTKGRRWKL